MTRLVTTLAAGAAAFALVAAPGVASAQSDSAVDENTGPASFANVAAVKIGDPGTNGGSVISETQRSPLVPSQSHLSQDRTSVPKSGDKGETDSMGPNYVVYLGRFGPNGPFPAGVTSRGHNVVAALQRTHVPTAVAETHYALLDNARGGTGPTDHTVLAFENAKTSVDCSGPTKSTATIAADKLWVRNGKDELARVPVPAGDKSFRVTGIKLGAPVAVAGATPAKTTSDLTISRLTSFDQLLKQDAWRRGDITVAAGWQVDIVSHVVKGNAKPEDIHTKIVLGGVSCSLPKTFAAMAMSGGISGPVTQPSVPTNIPAGVMPPDADAGGGSLLGFSLLGAGFLLASGAALALRRRQPAPRVEAEYK
jgi:hypothetical protein